MIKALLISNGIEGLHDLYQGNATISYEIAEVGPDFAPDLNQFDLVIAPNGTDNIALWRIRAKIADYLQHGGTLFCFDGWFTDWVPGNRWIMDNSKKTIDVRYLPGQDSMGILDKFSLADLNFSKGISGWWACGYIEPADGAEVLVQDTWGRALVVIDRVTTKGLMVLTASGPLADFSYATTDDDGSMAAMSEFYHALLSIVPQKISVK
jgi:hypothetical protein